jgi:soluble lytic murein transglycosylase-like protein
MMSCRHGFRSTRPQILALIVLGLLGAGTLRAQTADFKHASMDAWRDRLMAQLDRSVARLTDVSGELPAPDVVRVASSEDATPLSPPVVLSPFTAPRREPWMPAVVAVLREHGLPGELLSVVSVESGFDPLALSPKGARGLWQLIPETARRYGLVVDGRRDERLDPIKSTAAAARYLKDLYLQFQDWPLALAAYNAGEDRVQRSLDRVGVRDFWALSRQAALPEETRRYVPAVLTKLAAPLAPPRLGPPSSTGDVVYGATAPAHGSIQADREMTSRTAFKLSDLF